MEDQITEMVDFAIFALIFGGAAIVIITIARIILSGLGTLS